MNTATLTAPPPAASAAPDLVALKARQQAAWSSGDYAVIGTTLQIVGESLCEALDLRAGERVLDVAAGNGNATLAAARRWCDVVSTDYVPALLERAAGARRGRRPARSQFQEADAEALPFADARFDVVLSTFGVMFTPEPGAGGGRAAARLPAGRPDRARQLDAGRLHRPGVQDDRPHMPPPAGVKSPALWGTEARLQRAVRPRAASIDSAPSGTSSSATARRSTGWRSSRPTTGRC